MTFAVNDRSRYASVAADRALSLAVHGAALAGEAYALHHALRPGQLLRYDLPKARTALVKIAARMYQE
jgi:hypothetical protein